MKEILKRHTKEAKHKYKRIKCNINSHKCTQVTRAHTHIANICTNTNARQCCIRVMSCVGLYAYMRVCMYADHSEPVFMCTHSKHMCLCTFLYKQRSLARINTHTYTRTLHRWTAMSFTQCVWTIENSIRYVLKHWNADGTSYDTRLFYFDCIKYFLTPCVSNDSSFSSAHSYRHAWPERDTYKLPLHLWPEIAMSNAMLNDKPEAETLILLLKNKTTTATSLHTIQLLRRHT